MEPELLDGNSDQEETFQGHSTRSHGRTLWSQPGLPYLQPLVDTLGVELVVTGEDSEQLPCLEITEADHTPGEGRRVSPHTHS